MPVALLAWRMSSSAGLAAVEEALELRWLPGHLFRRDSDHDVVAEGRIDAAVKAEVNDAPVQRGPGRCGRGVAEDLPECVDGRFPEVQPVAARADGEEELQVDRAGRKRLGGSELVADLLLERRGLG